ncbi:secretoglobin family 1D member 2-like isoform X2 [Eublepharis macularius]|uniref:Uteroglobin n=1 Tax=Eublepharis macularius TaxID=481883 RepID=A0AA97KRU8_EUBMA|nr:secretoglobin family 1D member 2-like isoform X2 [Eublepharis macularius]
MKLMTVLLLVTLAMCCYSAGAEPCPILIDILTQFLFAPEQQYMETIAPFAPSREMKQAVSDLKQCALKLPIDVLLAKGRVLTNVLAKCSEMS